MIELENPDFVAFTGDNIFGTSAIDAAESLFRAFSPVIKSGLPWAAVLGNHDQESTMNREEMMSFISLMDYSLSQTFPTAADLSYPAKRNRVPKIDGFGNYNLRVWGAPGSHLANSTVLNLYFLDSGDRTVVDGLRTYGWIKDSQPSWLCDISKEIQEYVACSFVNSGVLKTLVSMGDVKAVFIGFDHPNDFCRNLDVIWFCYDGGFGDHGYGVAGWPRRARVILAELGKGEKSWNGVEKIKTWK
ncbi:probable inactive purple acid phosphatase 28 [Olea europaea subsp. europaea]|uniref:Probable inactive purple acid phosphatase 28 n=1 Tax=Olea europaea subsp. europaea TaxID=158383 RepID=A0A8S0QI54_OLEEU|nr:probable inactive purple acid phosphatase 28 [Olea europaea subsp. europaea]